MIHYIRFLSGGTAVKALGLLSLPIYTSFLSPTEYGTYALILTYISIGSIVFAMNSHAAVGRFMYEEKLDIRLFLSTTIAMSVGFFIIFVIAIALIYESYLQKYLSINFREYGFIVLALIFFELMRVTYSQTLIPRRKSKEYNLLLVIRAYSVFFVSLMFLVLGLQVKAIIYSLLLVESAIFLYIASKLVKLVSFKFSLKIAKDIWNYSVYLLPYALSGVILAQIDRVMIANELSLNEAGLYSVAYTISSIPWLVFVLISKAWTPDYFKYMNSKNYSLLNRDIKVILFALLNLIVVFALFSAEISGLLISSQYVGLPKLIPLLSFSVIFMVLWQSWGRGIGYAKKTKWTSFIGFFAAAVNVLLNYFWIPLYGIEGAVFATIISYFVMAFLGYAISKYLLKVYTVGIFELKTFFSAVIALFSLILIDYLNFYPALFYYLKLMYVPLMGCLAFYKRQLILNFVKGIRK